MKSLMQLLVWGALGAGLVFLIYTNERSRRSSPSKTPAGATKPASASEQRPTAGAGSDKTAQTPATGSTEAPPATGESAGESTGDNGEQAAGSPGGALQELSMDQLKALCLRGCELTRATPVKEYCVGGKLQLGLSRESWERMADETVRRQHPFSCRSDEAPDDASCRLACERGGGVPFEEGVAVSRSPFTWRPIALRGSPPAAAIEDACLREAHGELVSADNLFRRCAKGCELACAKTKCVGEGEVVTGADRQGVAKPDNLGRCWTVCANGARAVRRGSLPGSCIAACVELYLLGDRGWFCPSLADSGSCTSDEDCALLPPGTPEKKSRLMCRSVWRVAVHPLQTKPAYHGEPCKKKAHYLGSSARCHVDPRLARTKMDKGRCVAVK